MGKSGYWFFLYPNSDQGHSQNLVGAKLDQYPSLDFAPMKILLVGFT